MLFEKTKNKWKFGLGMTHIQNKKLSKKGLGNDILSKFNRYQCDQIWQIFANLAKFQTSLSIY